MQFALMFVGAIACAAAAIVVVAVMHAPDTVPGEPEPALPDGNSRGDELLTWAAEYPDRTLAPDYLEDW